MAYTSYQQALGAITASDIKFGAEVAADPALSEFLCLAKRAKRAFKGQDVGAPCPRRLYSAQQKSQGVGLHHILEPMRIATWARANPVAAIAIGAGVVGGLIGLGYYLGSGR